MDKKEKIFQLLEHGGNSSKLNIFSGLRNEESSVFSSAHSPIALSHLDLSTKEFTEALQENIESLSAKYREVIILHYLEHQTIHDIKATIGMSESTVRNRLSYGLFLLKQQITQS